MNNKMLIVFIVIIAAVTIVIVSWRTPSSNTVTPTPTPTATATPTVTDAFEATPTVTTTVTATPTVTITTTATPTVTVTATPTPTAVSGAFEDITDANWVYGVTEQTVGSSTYFIDATDKKLIKKGTSNTDSGAVTVFTSKNNGEIGRFYVNGGSMYVVTKRDASTSYSKFQKVSLSGGSVAKLYEFFSAKYEATQFAVKKNNDTKTSFYIGLEGVNDKYEPAGMLVKNYSQQWIKAFVGVNKTAAVFKLAPKTDGTQLVGSFLIGSTTGDGDVTQAYVDVE